MRKLLVKLKVKYPALFFWYIRKKRWLKKLFIPDYRFVEDYYFKRHGVKPNHRNPRKYSEHVVKILLSQPPALKIQCADKYAVREYVKKKIGTQVLNELYGVYEDYGSFQESLKALPQKFVLRATHGAGWNYICKDKDEIDHKKLKAMFNFWLKSNFYYCRREKVYKTIKPRVVCEKYLEDPSGSLIDYKVYCFRGKPEFMHMVAGRYSNMVYNTYDANGKWMDIDFLRGKADKTVPLNPELPLEQLLNYSRMLSEDFDYVRVDFYYVNGGFIFGELTFTPGHGNYGLPEETDLFLGRFFEPSNQSL